jgi:hypothetical protein
MISHNFLDVAPAVEFPRRAAVEGNPAMEKRAARKGKESGPDRRMVIDERGQNQPKNKPSAQTMGTPPARRGGKKSKTLSAK